MTDEKKLGAGVEGTISKETWDGFGTFAKKDFFSKVGYRRDLQKAELICHPNLVNNIGFQSVRSILMKFVDEALRDTLQQVLF